MGSREENTRNIEHKSKYSSMKDITGQRFGRLTAIRPTDKRSGLYIVWEFLCDCGNVAYIAGSRVKGGHICSCGCSVHKYNLMGKKYGRLTVLERVKNNGNPQSNRTLWLCRCDCGNDATYSTNSIIRGKNKSCGCLSTENILKGQTLNRPYKGTRISQLISSNVRETNGSGINGVCYDPVNKKWRAYITLQGKMHSLGRYDTLEEAAHSRKRGEDKYFRPIIEEYKAINNNQINN